MKCDKLQRYTLDIDYDGNVISVQNDDGAYMDAYEVYAAIEELKARIQLDDDEMAGFLDLEEECGGGDLRNYIAELKKKLMPCLNGDCILTCEVVEKYGKENAELKQKLEDVQASMYADVVDANMENRRLKRALWLARAEMAKAWFCYWCARFGVESGFTKCDINGYSVNTTRTLRTIGDWINLWKNVEQKCMAKAEEYK